MGNYRRTIIGILLLAISQTSFGVVVWDWSIDNPVMSVGRMDDVIIHATIFNDPASETLSELDTNLPSEVVDILFLSGTTDTSLYNNYSYDEGIKGGGTIRSQFASVVLDPGESFSFVLYTLVPLVGGAMPGSHEMTINDLTLTASSQGPVSGGPVNITVVPLPGAIYLFITGILTLLGLRRVSST